ncbi:hypothetical protein [Microcoleus sp. S13_C5]|uniref:hypothetical protein n=1 Tax=Microcoleus sp. S13_C5 TaxID=3055411 RepID=UPI002FD00F01
MPLLGLNLGQTASLLRLRGFLAGQQAQTDVKRDRTYFLSKSHSSGLPILPVNV